MAVDRQFNVIKLEQATVSIDLLKNIKKDQETYQLRKNHKNTYAQIVESLRNSIFTNLPHILCKQRQN